MDRKNGLEINRNDRDVVSTPSLDRLLDQGVARALFRVKGLEDLLYFILRHHMVQSICAQKKDIPFYNLFHPGLDLVQSQTHHIWSRHPVKGVSLPPPA